MAIKKLKLTTNEQAYNRELKRIKQFIRRAEKRGFNYIDNVIPEKPIKITKKSVKELQKLTPKALYSKATYKDPNTGAVLTGTQGRQLEIERSRRRGEPDEPRKKVSAMPPMTKRRSEREVAYMKERTRIRAMQRRLEKRGYVFSPDFLAKNPADITPDELRKIRKINSKNIYNHAEYIDPETGKIVSGLVGRQLERSRAGKKGYETRLKNEAEREKAERKKERTIVDFEPNPKPPTGGGGGTPPSQTDVVLQTILDMIDNWSPNSGWLDWWEEIKEADKNKLANILKGAITMDGREEVAKRLEANAAEAIELANEIMYDSDGQYGTEVNRRFARFIEILRGRPLTIDESIEITGMQEADEDSGDVE